jgi:hypothetical protein
MDAMAPASTRLSTRRPELRGGLAAALLALGCSGPIVNDDPGESWGRRRAEACAGVTCLYLGTCELAPDGVTAYCICLPGYHPDESGHECLPDDASDPCAGVVCSGHGVCIVVDGDPRCLCEPGWAPDISGLNCLAPRPRRPPDGDAHGDAGGLPGGGGAVPPDGWHSTVVRHPAISAVDLVVMVDNSGSMREEQEALARWFPDLIRELVAPSDADGDRLPDHAPADDLHIGVISQDLGTAWYYVSTCPRPGGGDRGCFLHAPDPAAHGCAPAYPRFLERDSSNADEYDADRMGTDFACIATLGTDGCGFEQQIEAARRALVENTAPGGCNEGFLRPDSLLGVIWVSDENDGSVDPAHPEMFDPSRNADLGHLNIRTFLHQEMLLGVDSLFERLYVLRLLHDDRMVLGMIVGVPLDVRACAGYGDELDGCLDVLAMREMINPAESNELVPSCNTAMGLAYPPRRFVELAQMWGRDAYVGSICRDDWSDAVAAITARLAEKLPADFVCFDGDAAFDERRCLSGCLLVETLEDDRPCEIDPSCPPAACPVDPAVRLDALAACVDPSTGRECQPLKRDLGLAASGGHPQRQCLVRQAWRTPRSGVCGAPMADGWYHVRAGETSHGCAGIAFYRWSREPLFDRGTEATLYCPP